MNVILTCPHGDLVNNDVGAAIIAENLHYLLKTSGIACSLFINEIDRRRPGPDMNRPQSRNHPWRTALRQEMEGEFVLIDVHGFPGDSDSPYARDSCDIALLHTPGVTDRGMLQWYSESLEDQDLTSGVYPSRATDDLVIEACQRGARAAILAENCEEGWGTPDHHMVYARAHAETVRALLGMIG